jgi:hypothetical protein
MNKQFIQYIVNFTWCQNHSQRNTRAMFIYPKEVLNLRAITSRERYKKRTATFYIRAVLHLGEALCIYEYVRLNRESVARGPLHEVHCSLSWGSSWVMSMGHVHSSWVMFLSHVRHVMGVPIHGLCSCSSVKPIFMGCVHGPHSWVTGVHGSCSCL